VFCIEVRISHLPSRQPKLSLTLTLPAHSSNVPPMNALRKSQILLLAALVAILVSQGTRAQTAQNQWLVLQNGETLQGQVTRESDRYLLATSSGSRIYINDTNVRFVADSLDEVYWERWTRTDPGSDSQQSELFKWCLRHNMTRRAQQILQTIASLPESKNSNRSELLSRLAFDLQTAIESKVQESAKKEIAASEIRSLPTIEQKRTTSIERIPKIPTLGSTQASKKPWQPEKHLVNKAIRSMPRGTARQFKVKLQPSLLANCASCHNQSARTMPLAKSTFGNSTPEWMTRQNLYSLLLNSESLIEKATTAHGEQEKASFASSDPYISLLNFWTATVKGQSLDLVKPTALSTPTADSKPPATITVPGVVTEPLSSPKKDAYDPSDFNSGR